MLRVGLYTQRSIKSLFIKIFSVGIDKSIQICERCRATVVRIA
jgi:hypothetical protein